MHLFLEHKAPDKHLLDDRNHDLVIGLADWWPHVDDLPDRDALHLCLLAKEVLFHFFDVLAGDASHLQASGLNLAPLDRKVLFEKRKYRFVLDDPRRGVRLHIEVDRQVVGTEAPRCPSAEPGAGR